MINVGIVGYGNLGKGVLKAIQKCSDFNLVGVFTRRKAEDLNLPNGVNGYSTDIILEFKDKIDVLILCGGSAKDLPETTAKYLENFNTVDSFDTHAKIPEYLDNLKKVAEKSKKLSAISIGWDPGLFSIARAIFASVLPDGKDYTFWGKGVSQGHSDAIRKINGVKNAIQYTVPIQDAIDKVKGGEMPELSSLERHERVCYVCVEKEEDKDRIEKEIKEMPNYFKGYKTTVNFVSEQEVKAMQQKLSHGGEVIRTGKTSEENNQVLEFVLKLDSNPEFTGSVLVSYARAVYRLAKNGEFGVKTVFDIPLKYLSPKSEDSLIKELL